MFDCVFQHKYKVCQYSFERYLNLWYWICVSKHEWRFDVLICYAFTKIEYGIRRVTDGQTDRHTLTSQDTRGSIGRSARRRSTGPYQSLFGGGGGGAPLERGWQLFKALLLSTDTSDKIWDSEIFGLNCSSEIGEM